MVGVLANEVGLPITLDEVTKEAGGDGVGRPHVAAVLVRNGVVSTIQEAFDRYLAKGQPGYVEKERLYPDQAIKLARDSNAVPVIAHPLSLGLEPAELGRTIAELAELG